jgi:site-specific recombinase XerD
MKLTFDIVENIFSKYIESRGFSNKTLKLYSWEVREFFRWLRTNAGKIDVREIDKNDIVRYREFMFTDEKYCRTTQHGVMITLKTLFKYLFRNEYILLNPFDGLDFKESKVFKERKILTVEQMIIFLDSIKDNDKLSLRDMAIFELMYGTGLRISEVCKIDMTDIDLNIGKLLVREGKGKKDRVVPLGNNLIDRIKKYMKKSRPFFLNKLVDKTQSNALFFTSSGIRITPNNIEKSLNKRIKGSNLDVKISPHILRHSFATHILENGASIKHVKDILGHSSIETTVIYTHFSVKALKKILKMYHPRENELYEEINVKEIENILKEEKKSLT